LCVHVGGQVLSNSASYMGEHLLLDSHLGLTTDLSSYSSRSYFFKMRHKLSAWQIFPQQNLDSVLVTSLVSSSYILRSLHLKFVYVIKISNISYTFFAIFSGNMGLSTNSAILPEAEVLHSLLEQIFIFHVSEPALTF
jgi:hypothetical protein